MLMIILRKHIVTANNQRITQETWWVVYQWFYTECLGLKSMPKSKFWYCPDCRKLPKFKRKRRKLVTTIHVSVIDIYKSCCMKLRLVINFCYRMS